MLTNMSLELQTQHRNMDAHVIIMCLKELFDETSRTERHRALKEFFIVRWKGVLLWTPMFLKWLAILKNWVNWALHGLWVKRWLGHVVLDQNAQKPT